MNWNYPPPPPIIGKHRRHLVQSLYEDIHHFLNSVDWAHSHAEGGDDNKVSGTTWIELFIMFDTGSFRRPESDHVQSQAAKDRANQRAARRSSRATAARSKHHHRDTTRQATLTEELNLFKEITRAIIKHDADPEDAKLIHMEKRQILRRLAGLGVYGHQPAVNAFAKTSEITDDTITTAIIQQKVGANLETTKAQNDFRQNRNPNDRIKVKIVRIAYTHTVRWKRNYKPATTTNDTAEQPPQTTTSYTSRMIECNQCGASRETKWMQLRTTKGYRALRCLQCKAYKVSSHLKCQCGIIWHQCRIHMIDPTHHRSVGRTQAKAKTTITTKNLLPANRAKPTTPKPGRRVATKKPRSPTPKSASSPTR